MKGTFFNKPLEWNIETKGESWTQGSIVQGTLKVKNHGSDTISLTDAGVALAYADIKKIHTRTEGALKFDVKENFSDTELKAGTEKELSFSLKLPENCPITDKKASYYIAYGRNFSENQLQLKTEPKQLYSKIVSLLDTFHRFKLKEIKSAKTGVEFKLIPPTSRDMANLESLGLLFAMEGETLLMDFDFQVKKLDTSSITTKVSKDTVKIKKSATPKEYSLGRDMINQDQLLKILESVIAEVKLKSVF
jgi:sporulation-control protein spo0M